MSLSVPCLIFMCTKRDAPNGATNRTPLTGLQTERPYGAANRTPRLTTIPPAKPKELQELQELQEPQELQEHKRP